MKSLKWFPEPVQEWGAFTADGLRGVLGRPRLHPLAILVRETAQNSWDARLPRHTVNFSISGTEFDSKQRGVLQNTVFSRLPAEGLKLADSLAKKNLRALVIRDVNTAGLGGPVRAKDASENGSNRWIRFLLDIGVAKRNQIDGGTYGFGRSIAYNVSAPGTLIVYTRTADEIDEPESRLIASALGMPYSIPGNRFTGRHWWGEIKNKAIEPLRGREADRLAAGLGINPFQPGETGTAVMILDPLMRTPDPIRAMEFIAESIAWNLWPKMVKAEGRLPMEFSVMWNGDQIPIPDPAKVAPLAGFVRALRAIHGGSDPRTTRDGVEVVRLEGKSPQTTFGFLAVTKFAFGQNHTSVSLSEDEDTGAPEDQAAPFSGPSHHVALLRKPELVVKYLPGPELPEVDLQWGGVFVAAGKHNEAFAKAEPPTHDSWEPGTVDSKPDRRTVNMTLKQIKYEINRIAIPKVTSNQVSSNSVARIANELGSLFAGVPGQGSGGGPTTRAGTSSAGARSKKNASVTICGAGPVIEAGRRASEVRFEVNPCKGNTMTRVHITVDVAVGEQGHSEGKERPVGAPIPSITLVEGEGDFKLYDSRGTDITVLQDHRDITLSITNASKTNWRLLATAPDETALVFNIEVESPTKQHVSLDEA